MLDIYCNKYLKNLELLKGLSNLKSFLCSLIYSLNMEKIWCKLYFLYFPLFAFRLTLWHLEVTLEIVSIVLKFAMHDAVLESKECVFFFPFFCGFTIDKHNVIFHTVDLRRQAAGPSCVCTWVLGHYWSLLLTSDCGLVKSGL